MSFRVMVLIVAPALIAAPIAAQQPDDVGRILGRVLDRESSRPVEGVAIRVVDSRAAAVLTDADGRFLLASVARGIQQIELSHLAYGRHTQLVNVPTGATVEMEFRLAPEAIALEPIEVEVKLRNPGLVQRGFYDRGRWGFGTFFNAEDLDRGASFATLLREVPGLRLSSIGHSTFRHVPYFRRGLRICVPGIFVDGRPVRLVDMAIEDVVDTYDIAAMEVYRPGSAPGQFQTLRERCGAIVVWTASGNR